MSRRTGYEKELSFYAELFGVSVRTVKRWAATAEKPPFDAPAAMLGWWERNMTQRVPESILSAASGKSAPVQVDLPVPTVPVERRELLPVADDEMGIGATLKRLANAEVQAYRQLEEAIAEKDDAKQRAAQRLWTDISNQVRSMTKAAREDEVARSGLIPVGQAEQILVGVHADILSGFRGLFPDLCVVFGIPASAAGEGKWLALVDGICVKLRGEVLNVTE